MTPHQHTQMFTFQVILNVKSTAPGITTVEMLRCSLPPPRTVPLPLGTPSCCLAVFAATQFLWVHGSKDTVHYAGQALSQVFVHMREVRKQREGRKQSQALHFKTRHPVFHFSQRETLPPKAPTAYKNSAAVWGPSIQISKLVGDISH